MNKIPPDRGSDWQLWYAWFPVLPCDDSLHWLEYVLRQSKPGLWRWRYRSLQTERDKVLNEAARCEVRPL